MTILERAFELARGGQARTISEIRTQLNREGFEGVQGHLSGTAIQKQLRALIDTSRNNPSP